MSFFNKKNIHFFKFKKSQRIFVFLILVLIFSSFFIAPGFVFSPVLSESVIAQQDSFNENYSIIRQSTISSNPRTAILASVLPPQNSAFYNTAVEKMNNIENIIESHWDVSLVQMPLSQLTTARLDMFDAIMVVDMVNATVSENILESLANYPKQVVWVGYNTEDLYSLLAGEKIAYNSPGLVQDIEYEGRFFDISNDFKLHTILPINSPETRALGVVHTEDHVDSPLAIEINDRILLLPFNLPDWYDIDHYSLILIDLLHETFGHHTQSKTALLRLEDVNAYTYRRPRDLRDAFQFLSERNIPFHIAFIARYINPTSDIDLLFGEARRFNRIIQRMLQSGLMVLVQHGYTHQYENSISAAGFEFWDGDKNQPLNIDPYEYVPGRILAAQRLMQHYQLPVPDIWETPHYAQDDVSNGIINDHYPLRYESVHNVGYFPFTVRFDDTIYFPENLGYIDNPEEDFATIQKRLAYLSILDDTTASVFWHPWRDQEELERIVHMVEDAGYEFVSVYDLVEQDDSPGSALAVLGAYQEIADPISPIGPRDVLFAILYISFFLGTAIYVRNIYRIRKYCKSLQFKTKSVSELEQYAAVQNKKLPRIGILVPARNEGLVIGNTIRRLAKLDYPKEQYDVFIIPDERENDDDVEIQTQDVVREVGIELNTQHGTDFIHQIEVPRWYSGTFGSHEQTFEKSTKGRALNYALQVICSDPKWQAVDCIGVLDADGRLHIDVLKELAYSWMAYDSRLLQGPVFQVSNFKNVNLFGIVGGLELAIHHLTELPHRILGKQKVQFLAGTNYFISRKAIEAVGGWNQHALVEDAELALRLYKELGLIASWLSQPEIEQTPANFSVYRKQRERWVRGHLMLVKDIIDSNFSLPDKIHFLSKIFVAQMRFLWDISLPIIALTLLLTHSFVGIHPLVSVLSWYLMGVSIFIWDTYGYMYRKISGYIDDSMTVWHKVLQSVKLVFFIPIMMVAQAIPRMQASYNYLFKVNTTWYKTERTKEVVSD